MNAVRYDWGISNGCKFPVYVHVYNQYHLGISVHGKEFSYAGKGIYEQIPHCHEKRDFWYPVLAGFTNLNEASVKEVKDSLKHKGFGDNGYNLLSNNCRTFTFAIAHRLMVAGS